MISTKNILTVPLQFVNMKSTEKKYVVHSHFVGNKDIDKVISEIALNKAIAETLNIKVA